MDQAYASMEAIVAKNGTLPVIPNRPMMPAFCASNETTLYILGGCTVQNHKIYIGGKWARDLNEKEKLQLDQFAKQMAAANYATAMAAAAGVNPANVPHSIIYSVVYGLWGRWFRSQPTPPGLPPRRSRH